MASHFFKKLIQAKLFKIVESMYHEGGEGGGGEGGGLKMFYN